MLRVITRATDVLGWCPIFATLLAVALPAAAQDADGRKSPHEMFFAVVKSGDSQKFMRILHPDLRRQFDRPVVHNWMQEFNKRFGNYVGPDLTDFERGIELIQGRTAYKSSGTYRFEKGEVLGDFRLLDGELINFSCNTKGDKFDDWYQKPDTTDLYRVRGEDFLKEFIEGDPEIAHRLLHENLQKNVSLEQLKTMISNVETGVGKLRLISFDNEEQNAGPPFRLNMYYELEYEKSSLVARVSFEFSNLRGHILGFDLNADGEAAAELQPEYEKFLSVVGDNDFDGAYKMLHPRLKEEVDEPIMKLWMQVRHDAIGRFKRFAADYESKTVYNNGSKRFRGIGQAEFTNTVTEANVTLLDGQILGFALKSDLMPDDWFSQLKDTKYYEQKAEAFLKNWVDGKYESAFGQIHENLKTQFPVEKFKESMEAFNTNFGKVESIELVGSKVLSDDRDLVSCMFKATFENGAQADPTVNFEFSGLKGHIIGFNFPNPSTGNPENTNR